MRRILLLSTLWMLVFAANGCVGARYPEGYDDWPEEQQSQWREEHPLRPWERYGNGGEEEEEHENEEEQEEEEHI